MMTNTITNTTTNANANDSEEQEQKEFEAEEEERKRAAKRLRAAIEQCRTSSAGPAAPRAPAMTSLVRTST